MENNEQSLQTRPLAIITGADGGMGTEITRAVAQAGYRVIMASCRKQKAEAVRRTLMHDRPDLSIEVRRLDLASLASVAEFADTILSEGTPLTLLMNCAGTMETARHITEDGLERTVSVNYAGPYLLTRKLLPLMGRGSRVVNMVSCTYAIGHLGIVVNAADPGIVSTDIITMHMWFDPLTDLFFRPFIRTPRQGADTAIRLLLDEDGGQRTGTFNVSGHAKHLSEKYTQHRQMQELWERTEAIVKKWL